MHNIKSLGNDQISLYYEVIDQKIQDIQTDIINDIAIILGDIPYISYETYTNKETFFNYCKKYRSYIEKKKKEAFLVLTQQQKELEEEIYLRQLQLLKEIGINTPSMRVKIIIEATKGKYFKAFYEMITYIKMVKNGEKNKRPKEKKIYAPKTLVEQFEKLGTSLIEILINNLGPMPN